MRIVRNMKLLPKSPDDQHKALVRVLAILEVVAVSLYVIAVRRGYGQLSEFYEPLKFGAGALAILLGLVVWMYCGLRYFLLKRYEHGSCGSRLRIPLLLYLEGRALSRDCGDPASPTSTLLTSPSRQGHRFVHQLK